MSRQGPRGINPQLNRFFAASNSQPNDPDIPNPFQKGLPKRRSGWGHLKIDVYRI